MSVLAVTCSLGIVGGSHGNVEFEVEVLAGASLPQPYN